jgi:hypothetical protein
MRGQNITELIHGRKIKGPPKRQKRQYTIQQTDLNQYNNNKVLPRGTSNCTLINNSVIDEQSD